MVSNKCEYALRAVFELARQGGEEPKKSQEIASAQGIPPRFLEIILVELRNAGFVSAKRGSSGGYTLARSAREITVGQVIRSFQGQPNNPAQRDCPGRYAGDYAFSGLWGRVQSAISGVYDMTTFADLLQEEITGMCSGAPDYVI
jgi:Rrf2 family protein